MNELSARETVLIDLAKQKSWPIGSPSEVIIKANNNRVDIGAYCYSVKERKAGSRSGLKLVDVKTLCARRERFVDVLIQFFLSQRHHSGKALDTIHGYWTKYKIFLDWCESYQNFPDMTDAIERRRVVSEFCADLKVRYRLDPSATNKYADAQKAAISITSIAFCDDHVGHGIPRLFFSSTLQKPTEAPDDEVQAKSYAMCHAVYQGFSTFFIKNLRYPFRWQLPSYLGISLWVFPCIVKFRSPLGRQEEKLVRPVRSINFEVGRVRSLDELEKIYNNRDTARTCRNLMLKAINESNKDPRYIRRIELANHAVTAFMLIFQAKTGMNFKQVRELPWGEEFTVEKADQKFRVVKWRAGGVVRSFRVSLDFIEEFRGYLEFRRIILQGWIAEKLFIHMRSDRGVREINEFILGGFEVFLRKVDPDFYLVRTREWRAAKSDAVLAKNNVVIASDALQNEPATLLTHYAEGREIDQKRQFKKFYEQLSQVVVIIAKKLNHIGVAMCENPGNPEPEQGAPIVADCKVEFGCFFCKFFKVHADEVGIRKLFSCRYFIKRISYVNSSDDSQESLYLPVIKRIDEILDYIKSSSSEMGQLVEMVRFSVEEEYRLDPYWDGRIAVLAQVGVL